MLELGERYTLKAVALLATPGIPADERIRLRATLDQLQAALRDLHSSTGVPHREPSGTGHLPPAPSVPILWLEPIR